MHCQYWHAESDTLTATIICDLVPLADSRIVLDNAATEAWYGNKLDHCGRRHAFDNSESSKKDCTNCLDLMPAILSILILPPIRGSVDQRWRSEK